MHRSSRQTEERPLISKLADDIFGFFAFEIRSLQLHVDGIDKFLFEFPFVGIRVGAPCEMGGRVMVAAVKIA